MTKTGLAAAGGVLMLVMSAGAALAHHPIGGAMPQSFSHGLLSGIGHPVIGLDHLAFVVAAGIASALAGSRFVLPAAFILATVAGCLLLAAGGVALPLKEFAIAASVLAVGGLVMSGREVAPAVYVVLFAAAGLFHGSAYGEAIIGAEPTVIGAYLAGFGLVQFAIMALTAWSTERIGAAVSAPALQPRLAGAVVAGIGATFLIEHVEGIMFPGL